MCYCLEGVVYSCVGCVLSCAGGGISVAAVGGVMRWGGEGLVRDSGVLGLYGYGYGDDARWCKE